MASLLIFPGSSDFGLCFTQDVQFDCSSKQPCDLVPLMFSVMKIISLKMKRKRRRRRLFWATCSCAYKNLLTSCSLERYFTVLFLKHRCTLMRVIRGGTFKLLGKSSVTVLSSICIKHDMGTPIFCTFREMWACVDCSCRIAAIMEVPLFCSYCRICQSVSFIGWWKCLVW